MPQPTQIVEYRVAEHPVKRNPLLKITLAEAIVIVVILCILAAILFPVFAKTRCREGRRPVCQTNLKQIGLAVAQYSLDYDGDYPRLAVFTTASTVGPESIMSWRQVIHPYIRNREVFKCTHNPIRNSICALDGYPQSYEVTDTGPIRLDRIVSFEDVPSPGSTIMVFEENGNTPQAQQIGVPWDEDSGESGWTDILYSGHFDGSNYLFCDGHVKWIRPLKTVSRNNNLWHLNIHAPVSPRALEKLQAAARYSTRNESSHQSTRKDFNHKYFPVTVRN